MKTSERLRSGLLLMAVAIATPAIPGCGDDSRRDGTQAPVLEKDRAGLQRSAANYKKNYMNKGARRPGSAGP